MPNFDKRRRKRDKGRAAVLAGLFRSATSRARALPDFVVVGAQKCGTSSLYSYLLQHPHVLPAARKEVHFFDLHYQRGPGWYRSRFPLLSEVWWRGRLASTTVVTGEATPYYLFHPHAARRLAQTVPAAKLIVLLRDPAQRAYSHYVHNRERRREPLSFDDAIEAESERLRGERERMLDDESYQSVAYQHFSYVQRGLYVDQLRAYGACFPRSQVLVIRSEDLFSNTQETYGRVLRFLSLDPKPLKDPKPKNVGKYRGEPPPVLDGLRRFFAPHNQRLYEYLQTDLRW